MKRICFFLVLALAPSAAFVAWGAGLKIILPPETGIFKPGEQADIANAQCLICHSNEYVTTQPPLPRTFWRNTVVKMQEKYGAPIGSDQVDALADYLAQHYGTGPAQGATPPASLTTTLPAKPAPAGVALAKVDGAGLAVKFACIGCHLPDTKLVGPAWKQIAAKYQGDSTAPEKIAHQITQGGSGKWGPVPMPPFAQIPPADVKTLSEWVLGLNP